MKENPSIEYESKFQMYKLLNQKKSYANSKRNSADYQRSSQKDIETEPTVKNGSAMNQSRQVYFPF